MKLSAALGSNFNSTFQSAMNTTNSLQGHIRDLQRTQGDISAYQRAEAAIADLREEKERLENAGERNEAAIDRVNKQLATQEGRLSEVSGRLQAAGVDTNDLAAESERLRQEQERLVRSQEDLARATKAVEENKRALKATQRELLMQMGKLTIAAAAIYRGAIQPAAEFQSSMSDIRAQTGMTTEEIDMLGGVIREMGRTSRHSGQEIAEAYAAVAVRGQDVAHSAELMRTAMVLADATGGDLASTAYFLGNYFLKTGRDISYAERYINVFAHTAQATGIGLGTLQDYLFRANASLQLANISGTEATAIFGNLYQAGIRGANAYSGFQQVIQSLMLPSDGAAAALERLGINVQQMKDSGYDMTEIMFRVGDALEYVEDNTERLAIMQDLFTQQTAFAFADELFNQRDTLRELIPELYEAGDAAHGMGAAYIIAAARTDNFATEMQIARNTVNDIRISIGTALMPAVNDLIGGFAEGAGRVAEWAEENQDLIVTIAKVAVGLGVAKLAALALKVAYLKVKGVVLAVKAVKAGYAAAQAAMNAKTSISIALSKKELSTTSALIGAYIAKGKALVGKTAATLASKKAVIAEKVALVASKVATVAKTGATKAATVAQWLLNKAMLANPIGLIIAAIAAVIAIVVLLVKNWDTVKEAAARVWEAVKDVFSKILEFIKSVWESIKAAFAAAWEFIKGVFSAVGEFFAGVWGAITGVFSAVTGWFSQKFTEAWEAIKAVFSSVGAFFTGIWDTIKSIFTSIGTTIGTAIGDAFRAVVNAIIGFAGRLINGFINAINAAIGLINRIPGVNIPLLATVGLPMLEKGSNFTPANFIAGDVDGKGGEIVANARGRKVFTAAQTSEIFKNIKAAKAMLGATTPPPVSDSDTRQPTMAERIGGLIGALRGAAGNRAEEMTQAPLPALPGAPRGGGQTWNIEFRTEVHINGDAPGDLDEKLQKNNEKLLAMFKEFLRKQREDEGRMEYA